MPCVDGVKQVLMPGKAGEPQIGNFTGRVCGIFVNSLVGDFYWSFFEQHTGMDGLCLVRIGETPVGNGAGEDLKKPWPCILIQMVPGLPSSPGE